MLTTSRPEVQRWWNFYVSVLYFFFIFFCFAIAVFDLMHDVEAILHLPSMLTASVNRF